MGKRLFIILLICLLCTPSVFSRRSFSNRFFARFQAGISSGTFTDTRQDETEYKHSGAAGLIGVHAGYMFSREISMNLGFLSTTDNNSSLKVDGESADEFTSSYGLAAWTVGFSYYLPADFYISSDLRFVSQAVEDIGATETTFSGSGVGISLGKDWRASSRIMVGVSLFYFSDSLRGDVFIDAAGEKSDYEGSASHQQIGLALNFLWY